MVRCKEAKKSRTRGVFSYISGLDFFADAADRRFFSGLLTLTGIVHAKPVGF